MQSVPAKLQLLTLSAKLVVLSQLSPLLPNLRTLSLLFGYLATLARYDVVYEVRDRARFLKGLIDSSGIVQGQPQAKLALDEDDFRRGVIVDEQNDIEGGGDSQHSMTSEHVRHVLFDGKLAETKGEFQWGHCAVPICD